MNKLPEPFFVRVRRYYRENLGLGLPRWESFRLAWRTAWMDHKGY